ncbi:hypothetical protein [Saccharopolyspora gregorii]
MLGADRIRGRPAAVQQAAHHVDLVLAARRDLSIEMGTSFKPVLDSSSPVTRSEYEQATRELTARRAPAHHHGWNVNHGGYVGAVFTGPLGQGVKTGTHDVDGLGVGVINLQPFSHSRGAENSRSLESGQTLTVETAPEKVYLARVKVHAGMVAEATYKGNLDQLELFSRPDPRAAGITWNCRSRSWCG